MKLTNISLLALSASVISARFIEKHETDQVILSGANDDNQLYLIEFAPGRTAKVTEEQKWELKRVCKACAHLLHMLTSSERHQLHGHYRNARPWSSPIHDDVI